MDINDLVLSDEALNVIDNGAWVDGLFGDVSVKVTGLESEKAQKKLIELQEKLRKKNNGEPLTVEEKADCTRQVLVDCVLLDWDGIEQDGEPLKYSKALAKKFLFGRGGDRFTTLVITAAKKIDTETNSFVEVAEKNS